jgi:hypothetical protein
MREPGLRNRERDRAPGLLAFLGGRSGGAVGCANICSGTRCSVPLFRIMTEKQHPPARPEDQVLYGQWRAALERVIAASMARDATSVSTPEREAAQRECDAALAEFRKIANQVR